MYGSFVVQPHFSNYVPFGNVYINSNTTGTDAGDSFYGNVNIYGQTNLLGPVTGGLSYTGPTGITGNTGPQDLNRIATNRGATGNTVLQGGV